MLVKACESKIDDACLRLLKNLKQRNAAELCHIRREVFTGGAYRRVMNGRSDAMLRSGRGKGTYAAGTQMTALGKPVLPVDLQLGSTVDDVEGAVALHKEMATELSRLFPSTYAEVMNRIELLALGRGISDAGTVAQVSLEIFVRELEAVPLAGQPTDTKGRLTAAWLFIRELSVVVAPTIKNVEWVNGFLPLVYGEPTG